MAAQYLWLALYYHLYASYRRNPLLHASIGPDLLMHYTQRQKYVSSCAFMAAQYFGATYVTYTPRMGGIRL